MFKEGDHVYFKTWEELCNEYGESSPGIIRINDGKCELRKALLGDCFGKETHLKEKTGGMWIVTKRATVHFSPELFKPFFEPFFEPIDEAILKIKKEIWQQ